MCVPAVKRLQPQRNKKRELTLPAKAALNKRLAPAVTPNQPHSLRNTLLPLDREYSPLRGLHRLVIGSFDIGRDPAWNMAACTWVKLLTPMTANDPLALPLDCRAILLLQAIRSASVETSHLNNVAGRRNIEFRRAVSNVATDWHRRVLDDALF